MDACKIYTYQYMCMVILLHGEVHRVQHQTNHDFGQNNIWKPFTNILTSDQSRPVMRMPWMFYEKISTTSNDSVFKLFYNAQRLYLLWRKAYCVECISNKVTLMQLLFIDTRKNNGFNRKNVHILSCSNISWSTDTDHLSQRILCIITDTTDWMIGK